MENNNTQQTWVRVAHRLSLLITVLSVLAIVFVFGAFKWYGTIGADITPQATISVSGEGKAYATANIAQFTLTVRDMQDTVALAQDNATEWSNNIVAYLREQGIAEKDIKTTGYNIYPQYSYPEVRCMGNICPQPSRQLDGYEVSQSITVKVRNLDTVGTLLAGVGQRNVDSVGGVNFIVEDETNVQAEARQEAIANAEAKAKTLANQLGVKLVRIINFNENGHTPYYAKTEMAQSMSDGAGSVAPLLPVGENEYLSNVSITYEIR
ncbi:MAG: SIMPL domain-containing protein [Candidatus Paceibacterota bacterium]